MRCRLLVVAAVLAVAGFQSLGFACSICKCGDQAFFVNNARLLPRGAWVISIENLYLNKSAMQGGDDHHLELGLLKQKSPLGILHGEEPGMQSQQQNNLQIVVNYGLTDRLMLMASLPYTFNRFSQGTERFRTRTIKSAAVRLPVRLVFNSAVLQAVYPSFSAPTFRCKARITGTFAMAMFGVSTSPRNVGSPIAWI